MVIIIHKIIVKVQAFIMITACIQSYAMIVDNFIVEVRVLVSIMEGTVSNGNNNNTLIPSDM
jgi:hypothetical protein